MNQLPIHVEKIDQFRGTFLNSAHIVASLIPGSNVTTTKGVVALFFLVLNSAQASVASEPRAP